MRTNIVALCKLLFPNAKAQNIEEVIHCQSVAQIQQVLKRVKYARLFVTAQWRDFTFSPSLVVGFHADRLWYPLRSLLRFPSTTSLSPSSHLGSSDLVHVIITSCLASHLCMLQRCKVTSEHCRVMNCIVLSSTCSRRNATNTYLFDLVTYWYSNMIVIVYCYFLFSNNVFNGSRKD